MARLRQPRRAPRATSRPSPGRVVPTSRMRCPGTAIASDVKSARPSSGAKCRSSIRTTVVRSAARPRVAWTKQVWSESFVSGSTPRRRRLAAQERVERRRRGPASASGSRRRALGAELLPERRAERARRRRRAVRAGSCRRGSSASSPSRWSRPTSSSTRRDLPMPASPSMRTTWPSPAFAFSYEGAQPRELGLAAVDRRLARDADAPERPVRLGADRLRPRRPPRGPLALLEHARGASVASAKRAAGLLREEAVDDLLEERRELRVDVAEPPRLLVEHPPERSAATSSARYGFDAGRELVEDETRARAGRRARRRASRPRGTHSGAA